MIREFQGEYRWLSNFHLVDILFEGITYPSVEHAYMSAKSNKTSWKQFCMNPGTFPGVVKIKSKKLPIMDNWEGRKLKVMRTLLEQKFNNYQYGMLLMATGNQYIQEGNRWNDKFWGVCLKSGEGLNNLGKMIMDIRNLLPSPFNFLLNYNLEPNLIDKLKYIYKTVDYTLSFDQELGLEFIKQLLILFNDSDRHLSEIKTCLVVSKPYKNNPNFKEDRIKLLELYYKKKHYDKH